MKADFYLLDKNLKEPYPLILKGNANANLTVVVSEDGGIRNNFSSIFFALFS